MSAADRDLEGRVRRDAQTAVTALGLLIDHLSISRAGKRSLVRIAVDDDLSGLPAGDEATPVPPVTLDAVAEATARIGAALDDSDVLGQSPYVLEVTSPGTSSPLSLPRHFRRNVGRLVRLSLADDTEVTGRIVRADGSQLVIGAPADQARAAERVIPYVHIRRAGVQVEFTHAHENAYEPHDDQED